MERTQAVNISAARKVVAGGRREGGRRQGGTKKGKRTLSRARARKSARGKSGRRAAPELRRRGSADSRAHTS